MIPDEELKQFKDAEERASLAPWCLDNPLNPNDMSVWDGNKKFLGNLAECSIDEDGQLKYSVAFDLTRVADAELIILIRNNWRRVIDALELLSDIRAAQGARILSLIAERDALKASVQQLHNTMDTVYLKGVSEWKARAEGFAIHLSVVFQAMDDGVLVRDITRDGDSDWAIRAMDLMAKLKAAHDHLADYRKSMEGK